MAQDTFIITLPPRQLPLLQGWRVTPAHLAYRLGPGAHLFRSEGTAPPKGGLMVVDDQEFSPLAPTGPLCQEVIRECQARSFSGAILDFENCLPPLEQIAARLDEQFARRGWTLLVPERYGAHAPHSRVMIPSALSGGSLQKRLEEALERFGESRVVLALEKRAEDFYLPSPTGSGQPLNDQELAELKRRLSPSVFFSGELCARYFTYMSRENGHPAAQDGGSPPAGHPHLPGPLGRDRPLRRPGRHSAPPGAADRPQIKLHRPVPIFEGGPVS